MDGRRRLILLRHAQAEDEGPGDHGRPLTDRGRADAVAAGRRLRATELRADRALVSTAVRARQTWELVASELGGQLVTLLEDDVYANTVDDVLALIRDTPEDVQTLLLVGHSPSIPDLVQALDDGTGDEGLRAQVVEGFPSSAFAVLSHEKSWRDVGAGRVRLESLVTPDG